MSQNLRIALTKGRLQDKAVSLFEAMGLDCTPIKNPGRRLIHTIPNYPLDGVLAKAPDVITYVEHGVCDLGIAGKDTILEQDPEDRTGIGIRNVNDRLRIYFGPPYGLHITSELDVGTCVEIRMPKVREGDYEAN